MEQSHQIKMRITSNFNEQKFIIPVLNNSCNIRWLSQETYRRFCKLNKQDLPNNDHQSLIAFMKNDCLLDADDVIVNVLQDMDEIYVLDPNRHEKWRIENDHHSSSLKRLLNSRKHVIDGTSHRFSRELRGSSGYSSSSGRLKQRVKSPSSAASSSSPRSIYDLEESVSDHYWLLLDEKNGKSSGDGNPAKYRELMIRIPSVEWRNHEQLGIRVQPKSLMKFRSEIRLNGLLVKSIEEGSFMTEWLRVDDVILEINSISLQNMEFDESLKLFNQIKSTTRDPLSLTILRKKFIRSDDDTIYSINNIQSSINALSTTSSNKCHMISIDLIKGPQGLGLKLASRETVSNLTNYHPSHRQSPLFIKAILPIGAAVVDGRLRCGDRLINVNHVNVTNMTLPSVVQLLHGISLGSVVNLKVLRLTPSSNTNNYNNINVSNETKGRTPIIRSEIDENDMERTFLTLNIPFNSTCSAGLGMKIMGRTQQRYDGVRVDLGLFIRFIMKGGAADRDGRLKKQDQIININGVSLLSRNNEQAYELLREAIAHPIREEYAQLVIARQKRDKKRSNYSLLAPYTLHTPFISAPLSDNDMNDSDNEISRIPIIHSRDNSHNEDQYIDMSVTNKMKKSLTFHHSSLDYRRPSDEEKSNFKRNAAERQSISEKRFQLKETNRRDRRQNISKYQSRSMSQDSYYTENNRSINEKKYDERISGAEIDVDCGKVVDLKTFNSSQKFTLRRPSLGTIRSESCNSILEQKESSNEELPTIHRSRDDKHKYVRLPELSNSYDSNLASHLYKKKDLSYHLPNDDDITTDNSQSSNEKKSKLKKLKNFLKFKSEKIFMKENLSALDTNNNSEFSNKNNNNNNNHEILIATNGDTIRKRTISLGRNGNTQKLNNQKMKNSDETFIRNNYIQVFPQRIVDDSDNEKETNKNFQFSNTFYRTSTTDDSTDKSSNKSFVRNSNDSFTRKHIHYLTDELNCNTIRRIPQLRLTDQQQQQQQQQQSFSPSLQQSM
ncbi:hypothetical protein SNEBB_000653 [Seison nebaliae]|nr:hypothetical protein SNEBB_000653 [Seison nebaliae]